MGEGGKGTRAESWGSSGESQLEWVLRELWGLTRLMTFTLEPASWSLTQLGPGSEYLGYPVAELVDRPGWFLEWLHPADRETVRARLSSSPSGEGPLELEFRLGHRQRSYHWFCSMLRLQDRESGPGQLGVWTGLALEVSRFREHLDSFQTMAETAEDILFHYRLVPERRLVYINPATERIVGYTREEHYADPDLGERIIHPDDRPRFHDLIQSGRYLREVYELRWIRKDGSVVWTETRNTPVYDPSGELVAVYGVSRDITQRKELEAELEQARKMEAVGRLAGGVAHEFNNLLMAIQGFASLLLDELSAESPLRPDLEEIQKAAQQGELLTRQLLSFGRRQILQRQILDVNQVISGTRPLLARLLGEGIRLEMQLDSEVGNVEADPAQLEQALVTLAINAREAMPEGGTLVIETGRGGRPPEARRSSDSFVRISVSDTGCGMDPETVKHIFEPFFSTKGKRKGTGLGLASLYGAVRQSGGHIDVQSQPGRGTSFHIFLPRLEEEIRAEQGEVSPQDSCEPARILLVEDEDSVREVVRRALKRSGHQVVVAANAREALEASHRGAFSLLVTDMVLPDQGGGKLAEILKKKFPGLKVLYISGYTEDARLGRGTPGEGEDFLQKPFSPQTLLRKVREILSS